MKKTIWLGLLCVLMGFQLSAQSAAEKEGDKAYGAKDYRKAMTFYKQAIIQNPEDLDLQIKLANCFRISGAFNLAESYYSKIVKNDKADDLQHYWYGRVLMALGKYSDAKAAFSKYALTKPNRAQHAINACDFALSHQKGSSPYVVEHEDKVSDDKYDDYAPTFYNDELIFASSRQRKIPGQGYSSAYTQNFFWLANRKNSGRLNDVEILKEDLANNLAPVAYRKDGKMAIVTFNNFKQGIRHIRDGGLHKLSMEYLTIKDKDDIDKPGKEFKALKGNDMSSFPSFSPDGKAVYFAAESIIGKTGYGGMDIYVTFYQNGKWTEPQNLGPNVNTEGDEICPYLSSDDEMYFASDFHKGFGGFDTYKAEKENNIWKNIRNLGHIVNSTKDDMYFIMDKSKKTGYFASNRKGNLDIYRANLQGDEDDLPKVVDGEQYVMIKDPFNPTDKDDVASNNNDKNDDDLSGTWGNGDNNNKLGDGSTKKVDEWPGDDVTKNADDKGNKATQPCGMNFYIGGVVDGITGDPIEDAVIYIKNNATQEKRMVAKPSNKYGEYSVILKPLTEFTVLISRLGYENLMFGVNTGTGGKKTLLGVREMKRVGGAKDVDPFGDPIKPDITETKKSKVPTNRNYVPVDNTRTVPETGYLIQAIATKSLDPAREYKLKQYGNIIKEPKNGLTVYQVGVFANKEHCEESLADIREMGYTDAFIKPVDLANASVGDKIANSGRIIYPATIGGSDTETIVEKTENINTEPSSTPNFTYDREPEPSQPSSNEPEVIVKEKEYDNWAKNNGLTGRGGKTETAPQPLGVQFKVQLGAFKDAVDDSFTHLSALGSIEKQRRSNGLIYYYLASYSTIQKAREIRAKAQDKGIETAFIVAFKNGKRVKLSEVLE